MRQERPRIVTTHQHRSSSARLVAAGHDVRDIARSPEKSAQLRVQGPEPLEGLDVFGATDI